MARCVPEVEWARWKRDTVQEMGVEQEVRGRVKSGLDSGKAKAGSTKGGCCERSDTKGGALFQPRRAESRQSQLLLECMLGVLPRYFKVTSHYKAKGLLCDAHLFFSICCGLQTI